jgi:oligopeptidase B
MVAGLITSEYRSITFLSNGDLEIATLIPRVTGIYYEVSHSLGFFYMRTNQGALNYKIVKFPVGDTSSQIDIVFARENVFIERMDVFKEYIIYWTRENGFRLLNSIRLSDGTQYHHPIPTNQVYEMIQDFNMDWSGRHYRPFSSTCFTFVNSSLNTPPSLYALSMQSNEIRSLASFVSPLPLRDYVTARSLAPAHDFSTTRNAIPITYIHNQNTPLPKPLLLLSYGAYGGFEDPAWNANVFPLLDRGFVWAICHPRGEGDLGTRWYSGGKYQFKENSFLDTQACLEKLVSDGVADGSKLTLKGRSAGGLIAGQGIIDPKFNLKAVVGNVPFIDPIYDMIDVSVPWTVYEW